MCQRIGGRRLKLSLGEKIVNQLTWLINRERLELAEGRRHERVVPKNSSSTLILPNGEAYECRVIDVSLSGASIASIVKPPIGTNVVLGRMRGQVVRHHDKGLAIQFADLQDPDSLARSFGCPARRVSSFDELEAAFDEIVPNVAGREAPLFLEVVVAPDAHFVP